MFTYVVQWDKQSTRPFRDLEWTSFKYIVWPLNIGNWPWTLTVNKNEDNASIYYVDSLNEGTKALAKQQIPPQVHATLSKMSRESKPPFTLNPEVEVLLVPCQVRGEQRLRYVR